MVRENPRGGRARVASPDRVAGLDRRSHRLPLPRRLKQLEHERAVELLQIGGMTARREVDLTHQQPVAGGRANRPERVPDLVPVARVAEVPAELVLQQPQAEGLARAGIVAKLWVLHEPVDRVDAEAVHPALHPAPHHSLHRLDDLGVVPVEVGLLGIEGVQVPAARDLVARPGGAAESGDPVVRRPVYR